MNITVADIRRAIMGGGDVSSFAPFWRQVLGNPPVPVAPSLEMAALLPSPTALLEQIDGQLANTLTVTGQEENVSLPSRVKTSITLVAVAPYGRNIGRYLAQIIDEVRPDIITIDIGPRELSASMLYAFSLPGAVGLAVSGEIIAKNSGRVYARQIFYPGNVCETAIMKSWLSRVPLLPTGQLQRHHKSGSGSAQGYIDEGHLDRAILESNLLGAYRSLDESLSNITTLEEGLRITGEICTSLARTMTGKTRETVTDEACYVASRIMDISAAVSTRGRLPRILALVDVARYQDTTYILDLIQQGVTDEIYVPPKSRARDNETVLVGKHHDGLDEEVRDFIPETTMTQELFSRQLERFIAAKNNETLSPAGAHQLIADIVGRTRAHSDIARGASVRGSIALQEILSGLMEISGGLTRENIAKAALITLPSRISLRQKGNEIAVVSDIVKEALYDIRFSVSGEDTALSGVPGWLSSVNVLEGLKKLGQISPSQNQELAQKRLPAIVADADKNRELLKHLEAQNLLTKKQSGQYSLTRKALDYLLSELDRKLKAGEITPDEYRQQRDQLRQMLRNISEPRFKMPAREMANTIMEMMDAQDKQWSSELNFDTMHVYYHIKENSAGAELSPEKRDYYALKRLIDDLREQGILEGAEKASSFVLTGAALNLLLQYLVEKDPMGNGVQSAVELGRALVNEHNHEIRRYSRGDVFRDISVRHTLKEIVRQKKRISDVRSSDFRVFLKQPRKQQSDIVLCLDTSGSMGFQHKLMYARLAAAGLVRAAIENQDRIGLVAFDDHGQVTVPLMEKDADSLISRIAGLSARGNTNIGDGIRCSTDLLFQDHSHNQKHIILITDGQPTAISEKAFNRLKMLAEKDLTEESALLETRQARVRGVKVSAIHIAAKGETSGEFIRNIARAGKGKVRRINSSADLRTMLR